MINGKEIYELKNGNGKIKEFEDYDNELIFDGEYLNGKKNGKGKEYYKNGKIKFEGEYLYDGYLKGKFYLKEKVEFEGEYLFDKKWNGKGYDKDGNIIYELKNGNGKLKEYSYEGILIFEGEYLNGKKNGKGKEYNFEGILEFEGEYLNGQKNGKGKAYDENGDFKAEIEYLNGKEVHNK